MAVREFSVDPFIKLPDEIENNVKNYSGEEKEVYEAIHKARYLALSRFSMIKEGGEGAIIPKLLEDSRILAEELLDEKIWKELRDNRRRKGRVTESPQPWPIDVVGSSFGRRLTDRRYFLYKAMFKRIDKKNDWFPLWVAGVVTLYHNSLVESLCRGEGLIELKERVKSVLIPAMEVLENEEIYEREARLHARSSKPKTTRKKGTPLDPLILEAFGSRIVINEIDKGTPQALAVAEWLSGDHSDHNFTFKPLDEVSYEYDFGRVKTIAWSTFENKVSKLKPLK